MSFNGSGTFVINSTGNPVVTATVISSTWANALTADLATGLSTTITKDGQTAITANIPWSGYKITGLGAAGVAGDALSWGATANVSGLTIGTLTGVLKGATGVVSAATAGTDYAKPDTASTWTAKQTFTGAATTLAAKFNNVLEVITTAATAATGTIAYDLVTQSVVYYTSSAAANWTVNFRGDASNSLDSLMAAGECLTAAFAVTQGATAYYNSAVQVDGTTVGVTTKWLGSTPAAGNSNSVDFYTYAIVKTGSATFTVFASLAKFV